MRAQIDVSLTDDPPIAQAIVVISALPETAAPA
jgi:phosphopantetheinyl transferase (holo-ACP synthase)